MWSHSCFFVRVGVDMRQIFSLIHPSWATRWMGYNGQLMQWPSANQGVELQFYTSAEKEIQK